MMRDLAALTIVLAGAAALLRGLDVLPQALGEPAGGRPFARIADVERRLGERLALPAYFPQTLPWPPSRIRVGGQRPAAVIVDFGDRASFAQTIGGEREIPERLWPRGVVLDSAEIDLGASIGTIEQVLASDGRTLREVRWTRWDRSFALRSPGSAQELVQMARSVRR